MRKTGSDGVATIGAVAFKLTEWEYIPKANLVEIPAAGDTGTARTKVREDWEANIRGVMEDGSFTDFTGSIGDNVAIVLKDDSTASPDISISKTGALAEAPITVPIDRGIEIRAKIVCSSGSDSASIA